MHIWWDQFDSFRFAVSREDACICSSEADRCVRACVRVWVRREKSDNAEKYRNGSSCLHELNYVSLTHTATASAGKRNSSYFSHTHTHTDTSSQLTVYRRTWAWRHAHCSSLIVFSSPRFRLHTQWEYHCNCECALSSHKWRYNTENTSFDCISPQTLLFNWEYYIVRVCQRSLLSNHMCSAYTQ